MGVEGEGEGEGEGEREREGEGERERERGRTRASEGSGARRRSGAVCRCDEERLLKEVAHLADAHGRRRRRACRASARKGAEEARVCEELRWLRADVAVCAPATVSTCMQ